jgi:hypothetical protein
MRFPLMAVDGPGSRTPGPIGLGTSLRTRLQRSYEVPRKASRIFKDYVLDLYYPLHRLSPLQRMRTAPLLFGVEYLVYRVDAIAEGVQNADISTNDNYARLQRYKDKLEAFLRFAHAFDRTVSHHMEMGKQYVILENRVTSSRLFDHATVIRLAELRPSDVRLLHSMMITLLGRADGDRLLTLTWPVEVLADIGNDLAHYRDDVANSRFNTFAMFVELYGDEAPKRLRSEIERYERLFLAELGNFPSARRDELGAICARRYRAQTAAIPEILPQGHYMSREREGAP